MVVRETPWPQGTPCWVDISVDDVDRARAFYRELFGWTVEPGPPEAGGYTMCLVDGRVVAAIGPKLDPTAKTAWITYLATDDADATVAAVAEAGGTVPLPPFDVLDVGRIALAIDPGGAMVGLWQARSHTGFQRANEVGAVAWNEQMSGAFEQCKEFYASVFGHTFGDISADGFTYATLLLDGREVGGIGGQPADQPAGWSTYFAVADTDDAVRLVEKLGGRVLQAPSDSPYGRMAVVADDQGGVFSVISLTSDESTKD